MSTSTDVVLPKKYFYRLRAGKIHLCENDDGKAICGKSYKAKGLSYGEARTQGKLCEDCREAHRQKLLARDRNRKGTPPQPVAAAPAPAEEESPLDVLIESLKRLNEARKELQGAEAVLVNAKKELGVQIEQVKDQIRKAMDSLKV